MKNSNTKNRKTTAFTIIEIIVVMVILAIAAMLAVPMVSSAADMQLRSAANILSADLEYAKSLAITKQRSHSVIFDVGNNSYAIHDSDGPIAHPTRPSQNFSFDFDADSRLNRVEIDSALINGAATPITFDYLGSPYSGIGTTTPLNSGVITLKADTITMTVNIEPVTGYITVQ
jgi:prepilin-type N-terminal cleavage/methylation domain-containing protein